MTTTIPAAFSTTISSVSSTTLTLAATPPALPTFGARFVLFLGVTTPIKHPIAKILSVSGNDIVVDYVPAGVATTQTIRISSTLEDVYDSDPTGITRESEASYIFDDGDVEVRSTTFLAMYDQSLTIGSDAVMKPFDSAAVTGLFTMGYLNQDGVVEGGCYYSFRSTATTSLGNFPVTSNGVASGFTIRWFGSNINWGGATFLYMLDGNDTAAHYELIDNRFNIYGGFRLSGTTTILKDNLFLSQDDSYTSYPFSTKGLLGETSNNAVEGGGQAFYWNAAVSFGGTTTLRSLTANNVTDDLNVRIQSDDQTLTLINDGLNDNLTIVFGPGTSTGCNIDRYVSLRPTAKELDGTLIAGVVMRNINTDQGQVLSDETEADGMIAEQLVWRQRQDLGAGTIGTRLDYYNNTLRTGKYGLIGTSEAWDSRTKFDTIKFYAEDTLLVSNEATATTLAGRLTIDVGAETVDFDNMTSQEAYDALSYWWPHINGLTIDKFFSISGTVITLSGSWTGSDINGSIIDADGSRIAANATISNIVAGSRLRIYNVTTATEVVNEIVAGTTYVDNYLSGVGYNDGDTIEVRLTYYSTVTSKEAYTATAVATADGWSLFASQVDQLVYNTYGVDGSTVTEFSWDSGNLEVDVNDSDNATTIQRTAAWYYYFITTSTGIDEAFGALSWDTINSIEINSSVVDMTLDNRKTTPLMLTGGRLFRSDGATIIAATSNSVQVDYDPVYTVETGVSGLTASESADLAEISDVKTNTDLIPALI